MAKRRTKPRPQPTPNLGQLLRGEIAGGVLVLLAILILLSLLSSNRGQVTAVLIELLQMVFGIGVWLLPWVLGGLGIWLALRDVTEDGLSAWRLAGGVGLFLACEGFAHLIAGRPESGAFADQGAGGGLVGWALAEGLIVALGLPVGIAFLVILLSLSLVALAGLSLHDLHRKAGALVAHLRGGSTGADEGPVGPLFTEGTRPFWRRWLDKLRQWWPRPSRAPQPPPLPSATAATPPWAQRQPVLPPARAPAPQPVRAPQPVPAEPEPRIIGGPGQTWHLPALADILEESTEQDIQQEDLRRRVQIIEKTLADFGVPVQVVEVNQGPAVTQFGLRPGTITRRDRKGEEKQIKVRVSQIQALANDLSLALAASPIRIEAPVPGRDFVGVEVPNVQISLVSLRGVLESEEFRKAEGALVFGLGRDVSGQPVVADLTRMPHLLIAGATGAGKSVCVNSIITSFLLTHTPETLRFLMIDPKRVELTVYNGIPHLVAPVVVDVERAVPVLQWATREMERRYKLFAKLGARNIEGYNAKVAARGEQTLPYIVIFVDELADLMLSAPDEVERYICRIAQMARATGMHLVLATQRPSVDVVTGLIKANFPARIAFAVTSQVDSRVILDTPGAEQLLGRGDMLFMAPDSSKLQRLQGCFVSDRETHRLVRFWKGAHALAEPLPLAPEERVPAETEAAERDASDRPPLAAPPAPPWLPGQETLQQPLWEEVAAAAATTSERDALYDQAVEEVRRAGKASISLLQRRLRIGYSRAARLIEQMEADGIVGPELGGSRSREVLLEKSPDQRR